MKSDSITRSREAEGIDVFEGASKRTSKLEGILYAALSIAVFYYILWETRSFWVEWAEMWFGKGV